MNSKIKTNLLLLTLLSGIIYLAACNKSSSAPASLIGTWAAVSEEERLTVHGVVKFDTVILVPVGQNVLTFTADGYYVQLTGHGMSGGPYTYTGTKLSIFDTSNGSNIWRPYTVSTLTGNKLSMIVVVDTVSLSPIDSIGMIIANYAK
jgi:hypothetical protein